MRWIIGASLAVWAVGAVGIVVLFPRARAEVTLVYLPIAAGIVWIGRRTERRELGLPEPPRTGIAGRILLAVTVMATCGCGTCAFYAFNSEPFLPSPRELLPLPPGLHATDISTDPERNCGTGSCTRRFTISGEPGRSPAEIREQVRVHLNGRGWNLGLEPWDCHQAGWILDQTTICASVSVQEGTVHVSFEGGRAWP